MKKNVILIISMLLCLFLISSVEASSNRSRIKIEVIPISEITIGGIGKNCTFDYVKQIYGEPDWIKYHKDKNNVDAIVFKYGNFGPNWSWSLHAELINGQYYITGMTVLNDRSLSTPAGIHVGSTAGEVRAAYGGHNDYASDCEWHFFDSHPQYYSDTAELYIYTRDYKVYNIGVRYSYDS